MMMLFGFFPLLFLFVIFGLLGVFRRFAAVRHVSESPEARDEPRSGRLDGAVFSLAKRLGGRLTLSDVVVETGLNLAEAERYMDSLVDNAHVSVEVDENGRLCYEFPELRNDTGEKNE